eukprot:233685_1
MDAKNDLLALIAFIISEYAEIKSSINTTLEFRAIIKSTDINTNLIRADVFENMLCAATWNGILYLVNPLNHNKLNSHIYTINNGYHSGNLQQRMLCEIQSSSKILFDPNLCCSVSHIVNRKQIPYKNTNIFYPNSSMIIDGLIFCNSELNIVYGYSIISGLYQIQKFKKTKSHNDIERYEVVINLWRQNIDAFVLTSKFNLYGIRIEQNSFRKIAKICCFKQALNDIKDIEKYINCWYDIDNKILFLVYKNINNNNVQFKMYESDRIYRDYDDKEDECDGTIVWDKYSNASTIDIQIPKSLEFILDNTYTKYNKSKLFYHKPSNTLLLFFGLYLIQITIDFKMKILTTVNVGIIHNVDFDDKQKYDADVQLQEIKRDLMKLNNERISNHLMGDIESMQNLSINSELINEKPLPLESTITDHIIGYDEFRSCIILNFNQYQKELSTLYKFEVSIMRATDFASDWKKLLPL